MNEENKDKLNPPYIPFKTFKRFLEILKETVTPDVIDSSVLSKFSGSDKAALLPAIKFLGITDKENKVIRKRLEPLVKSFKTEEWGKVFGEVVKSSYEEIINDLPLSTATMKQLEDRFKTADPSIIPKAIRFFKAASNEVGIELSSFIKMRKPREKKSKTKTVKSEGPDNANGKKGSAIQEVERGYKEFPLPIINKKPAKILVPEDIENADWQRIKRMVQPVLMMIETYFGFENKKEE
jgi:hypothetical protein